MFDLQDILSYAIFTGLELAALCAMTRGGRGWPWRVFALAVLVGVDFLVQWLWCFGEMPLDQWLAVCFSAKWIVVAALVVFLSRDSLGRRLFLSIAYGAYAVCYAAVFHLLAYRNDIGLPGWGAGAFGIAALAVLNLVFFLWVLPSMPQDDRYYRWRIPNIVAGVVAVSVFVSGVWPTSVVTAPVRYCSAFALSSVVAWVAFPLLCRMMRERLHAVAAERSLERMMAEVKERRAAIDMARRLRHDQRHHRVQIAEYMLSGQYEKVFAYLKELDEEAREAPTDKLVWCGNETINAILSGCARKAAAKGVGFTAEVYVELAVALPDVELVAVFANLIENAIDATGAISGRLKVEGEEQVKARDDGKVTVTIRQREFGIGITVTNPVPTDFAITDKGLPCAEPGIGMESIRRVVERHDGQWTYELEGGLLKCQVILMTEGSWEENEDCTCRR